MTWQPFGLNRGRRSVKRKHEEILEAWDRIEENEPDISTERLWAMVMDETGCEYDDVTEALALQAKKKK